MMPIFASICRLCTLRKIRLIFVTFIVGTGVLMMAITMTRDQKPKTYTTMGIEEKHTINKVIVSTPLNNTEIFEPKGSTVAVHGIDISMSKLKVYKGGYDYLLILPHATKTIYTLENNNDENINTDDKNTIKRLVNFLQNRPRYDGASCFGSSKQKLFYNSCYFETRNWTLLIGKHRKSTKRNAAHFVECNIIENAFLIRRRVFEKLYLNPPYGATTLLDFYLRSKGRLKIAAFRDCSFSTRLNRRDRGGLEESSFFTDYIYLGNYHHIVRIVREHHIFWIKCTHNAKICPERPFNSSILSKKHMPVCCSHVLDRMLHDVIEGLNALGLDYRIVYGTLLGAVRSGTIIPWTNDVDIALNEEDYFNDRNFKSLERYIRSKNYAVPVFKGQRRVIPLFPPSRAVRGSPFDPKFQHRLFSRGMMRVLKRLSSSKTRWQDLGYLDFYIGKKEYFQSSSKVQINGRNYSTVVDKKQRLREWYGNYIKRVKSQSAPKEIDIVERRKMREKTAKKDRKKRRKRNAKNKQKRN